jgi:hypothetical protein
MIQELLAAYEASALGHAARNTVWLYPLANLVHVLGASLLVGAIAVFDILVLRRRYQTAASAGRVAIPLAATGLALQAASGLVLFSAEATTIARNPAFLFKMIMLVIGWPTSPPFTPFIAYQRWPRRAMARRSGWGRWCRSAYGSSCSWPAAPSPTASRLLKDSPPAAILRDARYRSLLRMRFFNRLPHPRIKSGAGSEEGRRPVSKGLLGLFSAAC